MLQLRYRDKFVVVSEAPWRVFDHLELDIFPTEILLTNNLYQHFKKFAFQDFRNISETQKSVGDETVADKEVAKQEKKYSLLVPKNMQRFGGFGFGKPSQKDDAVNDDDSVSRSIQSRSKVDLDKIVMADEQARNLMLDKRDRKPKKTET
jgi:hypothetical protein